MLFNYAYYSFANQIKAVMTRQHTFLLKCIKFYSSFCKQSYDETTQACKKLKEVQYRKKAFKLMYVHVQYAYTCEWPGLPGQLLPSLPKAQLTHSSFRTGLTISSMLPSTTSFHQLPAGRPSSSLFVMVFRVADHSWPVAMADCCMCTTPGPFIPNI